MSIQDDAFDIELACKDTCPSSCKAFIEWAWSVEKERNNLFKDNFRLNTCLDVLDEHLLRRILSDRDKTNR